MNGIGIAVNVISPQLIKDISKKVKFALKNKKKILILGCSGVGKTQFINSINDNDKTKQNTKISIDDRTSTNYDVKLFMEDSAILLTDTPGEFFNDILRKTEITELFRNKGEGIINIVSYGYHEGPAENINEVFYDKNKLKTEYVDKCLKKEIDQLNQWVHFMSITEIKWVITLVTKADVWWSDQWKSVKKYYESGDYGNKISKLKENGIQHIILPYCSIIEPFYEIKGSEEFGETKKNELHERFLRELLNLLKSK